MLLNPNLTKEEISDEEIIYEYLNEQNYKKANLHEIMAVRANENTQIKELLFDIITDSKKRTEYFAGSLIHSWLPTLFILEHGNLNLKNELKSLLSSTWSIEEKSSFLSYLRNDHQKLSFLKDF